MNGYELSRQFFDFAFEHHECGVIHTAIYMLAIEQNNRFGWKKEFGFPTADNCEKLSIGNRNTYLSAFRDLVKWGFIEVICESKNQFQATVISLCHVKIDIARDKAGYTALDKALIGQDTGHGYAIDTIDKQDNNQTMKQENKQTIVYEKKEIQNIDEDPETTYQDSMNLLKRNGTKMDNGEQIESPDFTLNYPEEWFKFNSYWTEKDRKGRTRAELQKTFDIKRRFANWISKNNETKIINPITRIGSL